MQQVDQSAKEKMGEFDGSVLSNYCSFGRSHKGEMSEGNGIRWEKMIIFLKISSNKTSLISNSKKVSFDTKFKKSEKILLHRVWLFRTMKQSLVNWRWMHSHFPWWRNSNNRSTISRRMMWKIFKPFLTLVKAKLVCNQTLKKQKVKPLNNAKFRKWLCYEKQRNQANRWRYPPNKCQQWKKSLTIQLLMFLNNTSLLMIKILHRLHYKEIISNLISSQWSVDLCGWNGAISIAVLILLVQNGFIFSNHSRSNHWKKVNRGWFRAWILTITLVSDKVIEDKTAFLEIPSGNDLLLHRSAIHLDQSILENMKELDEPQPDFQSD